MPLPLSQVLSTALAEANAGNRDAGTRLTQAEVVRRVTAAGHAVTYNQVNNWFRGEGRPDAALVPSLIDALEMSPATARLLMETLGLDAFVELGARIAGTSAAA